MALEKPTPRSRARVAMFLLAVAVAILKHNSKPMKGQFWSGAKIREIRGKYSHIRRNLQRKKRLDLVKRIGSKEGRIVNQILHTIAKEIVAYVKNRETSNSNGETQRN